MTPNNSVKTPTSASGKKVILADKNITDEMIEDGAYVVFDWDNTLKLYDPKTRTLTSRVSREFLLHLKHNRRCRLFIISAVRPSAINLSTILYEVDKLGLTDLFLSEWKDEDDDLQTDGDKVDAGPSSGTLTDVKPEVNSEYGRKGNIIICGYDKAETFLKISSLNAGQGDRVMFFDDEEVNVDNFSAIVPNSTCFHCQ
jgi:hypothetical protein